MDDIKPCLVVHHGGMWVEGEVMYYRGGRVNVFDDIPECVDSSYVKQLIDSLGYTDIVKLHYLDPRKTMADGVRFLGFDTNTFDPFLSLLLECRVIDMYSEHEIYMTPAFNIGSGTRSVNGSGGGTFMSLLQDCHAGVGFNAPRMSEQVEYDYDSEGTDEDDVEIVSARDKLTQEKKNEFDYEEELKMLKRVADSKGKGVHMFEDDWEGVSDEDSPNDDDDEEDVGYLIPPPNLTTPRGHRSNDITTSDFNLGQVFENAVMFRKALTDYCVDSGRNIEFYRNDKNRVGAKCRQHVKGCPWKIWASWESQKRNFVVKTYIGEHKCGRAAKVSVLKSTWIARNYANWFKVNPYMKLQDIRESIWLEKGIRVSKYQAFRARKKGQASIIGEYEEVNEFFTKTKYLKAYDFLLEPLNGPQEWPQSEAIVHPPKLKKVQGRPKTKRRYQAGETTASGKLRRTGQTQTCSLCGLKGHNKRGCKNAPKEREPAVQSQTTQEGPSAGTAPPNSVPMHMRGFGVYTYPNGFQRVASVPPCPRPPQHQPHTAIYTDVEGEKTVYSFSQDQYPMSSQQQSQNSNTITSQALQDLANKKRNSNK